MRPTSLISFALFVVSASAATILVRQTGQPPSCSVPCLNTGTNGVSLGDCSDTDLACQCRSAPYVQGVINCIAIHCASHDDLLTSLQFSNAFCGVYGVNSSPSGVTIPLSQLPPTATPGSNGTAAATSTTASATAAATTSHSGAVGSVQPRIALGAMLFAAMGVAAAL